MKLKKMKEVTKVISIEIILMLMLISFLPLAQAQIKISVPEEERRVTYTFIQEMTDPTVAYEPICTWGGLSAELVGCVGVKSVYICDTLELGGGQNGKITSLMEVFYTVWTNASENILSSWDFYVDIYWCDYAQSSVRNWIYSSERVTNFNTATTIPAFSSAVFPNVEKEAVIEVSLSAYRNAASYGEYRAFTGNYTIYNPGNSHRQGNPAQFNAWLDEPLNSSTHKKYPLENVSCGYSIYLKHFMGRVWSPDVRSGSCIVSGKYAAETNWTVIKTTDLVTIGAVTAKVILLNVTIPGSLASSAGEFQVKISCQYETGWLYYSFEKNCSFNIDLYNPTDIYISSPRWWDTFDTPIPIEFRLTAPDIALTEDARTQYTEVAIHKSDGTWWTDVFKGNLYIEPPFTWKIFKFDENGSVCPNGKYYVKVVAWQTTLSADKVEYAKGEKISDVFEVFHPAMVFLVKTLEFSYTVAEDRKVLSSTWEDMSADRHGKDPIPGYWASFDIYASINTTYAPTNWQIDICIGSGHFSPFYKYLVDSTPKTNVPPMTVRYIRKIPTAIVDENYKLNVKPLKIPLFNMSVSVAQPEQSNFQQYSLYGDAYAGLLDTDNEAFSVIVGGFTHPNVSTMASLIETDRLVVNVTRVWIYYPKPGGGTIEWFPPGFIQKYYSIDLVPDNVVIMTDQRKLNIPCGANYYDYSCYKVILEGLDFANVSISLSGLPKNWTVNLKYGVYGSIDVGADYPILYERLVGIKAHYSDDKVNGSMMFVSDAVYSNTYSTVVTGDYYSVSSDTTMAFHSKLIISGKNASTIADIPSGTIINAVLAVTIAALKGRTWYLKEAEVLPEIPILFGWFTIFWIGIILIILIPLVYWLAKSPDVKCAIRGGKYDKKRKICKIGRRSNVK